MLDRVAELADVAEPLPPAPKLHGGEPAITPIDSPGVKTAVAALEKGFGKKPRDQGEGGSIPIVVDFKKLLKADSVLLGFGLPDENAQAPNEFISLDNFFAGILVPVCTFTGSCRITGRREKNKKV